MTLSNILASLALGREPESLNSVAPTQNKIELSETDLSSVSGGYRKHHYHHHHKHHHHGHHGHHGWDDDDDYGDYGDCDYGDCDD